MVLPLAVFPRIPGTYSRAVGIVPADDLLFDIARAIYVGTGGLLIGQTPDGVAVITNVVAGTILRVRMNAVAATGTSAANLLALY